MSFLSDVRAAIAAQASGVKGVRVFHQYLPQSITAQPALVLGQVTWTTTAGAGREHTVWSIPLELYVARASTDERTIATSDELIDELRVAYTQGVTLSSVSGVQQSMVLGGRSNDWVDIGGMTFLLTTFDIELTEHAAREYTA